MQCAAVRMNPYGRMCRKLGITFVWCLLTMIYESSATYKLARFVQVSHPRTLGYVRLVLLILECLRWHISTIGFQKLGSCMGMPWQERRQQQNPVHCVWSEQNKLIHTYQWVLTSWQTKPYHSFICIYALCMYKVSERCGLLRFKTSWMYVYVSHTFVTFLLIFFGM